MERIGYNIKRTNTRISSINISTTNISTTYRNSYITINSAMLLFVHIFTRLYFIRLINSMYKELIGMIMISKYRPQATHTNPSPPKAFTSG